MDDGATAESIAAATLYGSSIFIHLSTSPPDADLFVPPMLGDGGDPTQVRFSGPKNMTIRWNVTAPGKFDSEPLVVPGRYNGCNRAIPSKTR